MARTIKIISIVRLCLMALVVANFAYAAFQLEVDFPTIGGERLVSTSTLPQVIKYGLNAFLLVSVLAVVVSLIYGGITYLNSTGRPDVMAKARKRIIGSGFGLGLVLLSVLLLQIVNPELAVPKINKVPVATGALFLNDEAFRLLSSDHYLAYIAGLPNDEARREAREMRYALLNPLDEDARIQMIQELLNNPAGNPRAIYLMWSVRDTRDMFGDFEVGLPVVGQEKHPDPRVRYKPPASGVFNFKNFKPKALWFLPGANMRLTTYYYPDFNETIGTVYHQGASAHTIEGLKIRESNEYVYPSCSLVRGEVCPLAMLEGKYTDTNKSGGFLTKSAPLSYDIDYFGKGVYVYVKDGEHLQTLPLSNLSTHIPYLSVYDFNDKAIGLKIENYDYVYNEQAAKWQGEKKDNYLAVLHEDEVFKGQLRLFFEKETIQPIGGALAGLIGNVGNQDCDSPDVKCILDFQKKEDRVDAYGKVDETSSLQVFKMPATNEDWQEWERKGGCTVKICGQVSKGTVEEEFHDCLIYKFSDRMSALFKPFSIPKGDLMVYRGDEEKEVGTAKLYDNVNSMQIEGNCVVVLFENNIHKEREAKCEQEPDKCWDKGGPGSHSEVFSPYDAEYPNYLDLTPTNIDKNRPKHEIGYCLSAIWPLGSYQSCVSSIAVFPLKIGD